MDKYLIRHRTLEILISKFYLVVYDSNPEGNTVKAELTDVPVKTIISTLDITEFEFRKANSHLANKKEIKYRYDKEETLSIEEDGVDAFEEQKYLKLRRNERDEMIYSKTKWLIPILTTLLSITAIIIATCKR